MIMWISLTLSGGTSPPAPLRGGEGRNLTPGPSPGRRGEELGKELVLNDNF